MPISNKPAPQMPISNKPAPQMPISNKPAHWQKRLIRCYFGNEMGSDRRAARFLNRPSVTVSQIVSGRIVIAERDLLALSRRITERHDDITQWEQEEIERNIARIKRYASQLHENANYAARFAENLLKDFASIRAKRTIPTWQNPKRLAPAAKPQRSPLSSRYRPAGARSANAQDVPLATLAANASNMPKTNVPGSNVPGGSLRSEQPTIAAQLTELSADLFASIKKAEKNENNS